MAVMAFDAVVAEHEEVAGRHHQITFGINVFLQFRAHGGLMRGQLAARGTWEIIVRQAVEIGFMLQFAVDEHPFVGHDMDMVAGQADNALDIIDGVPGINGLAQHGERPCRRFKHDDIPVMRFMQVVGVFRRQQFVPLLRVGIMLPEGMKKACKMKGRMMKNTSTTAIMPESSNSAKKRCGRAPTSDCAAASVFTAAASAEPLSHDTSAAPGAITGGGKGGRFRRFIGSQRKWRRFSHRPGKTFGDVCRQTQAAKDGQQRYRETRFVKIEHNAI